MSNFIEYHTKISLYECKRCGSITANEIEHTDDGTFCTICEELGGVERSDPEERTAEYVSMAIYSTHQCYGGPEEGGWYYAAGSRLNETLRAFKEEDLAEAEAYYNKLLAEVAELNEGRKAYRGDEYFEVRTYQEKIAPKHFPTNRPRYS